MNKLKISLLSICLLFLTILFGKNLYSNLHTSIENPKIAITSEKITSVDKSQERTSFELIAKTYLKASTTYDWETLKAITSGRYKEQLEKEIIPNAQKNLKINYKLKDGNISLNVISHLKNEAVINVTYIAEREVNDKKSNSQETIKLYLSKDKDIWKI